MYQRASYNIFADIPINTNAYIHNYRIVSMEKYEMLKKQTNKKKNCNQKPLCDCSYIT